MNQLVDTHCHIQSIGGQPVADDFTSQKWHKAGETNADKIIKDAASVGVSRLICVGTSLEDSAQAVKLAKNYPNVWPAVGVHPHEAKAFLTTFQDSSRHNSGLDFWYESLPKISCGRDQEETSKVIAIGEIGLDYYYEHSPKDKQKEVFEQFLDLAARKNKPVIFHVREAFNDFWPILANFKAVRGVLHSFSANTRELDKALKSGLYIGLNGIMTFTRDEEQLKAAKNVPLDRLLLETDAPYLAPKPHRGKVCKPEHVRDIAEFLAKLRGEKASELAAQTTKNAQQLFGLN
jgi:TatD DNase family protein